MHNVVQQCLAANNILLMRKGNRAFLLLAITLAWSLGDLMIKQLLNSIIVKYRDLSVSRRSIICRSRRLRQIIDLLATDKSQHFAQPRPKIVNYHSRQNFLPFHWPKAHHVTCKWLPTNNGLLMHNVVQLYLAKCLAANNILLMRKWNHAFLPLAIAVV